MGRLQLRKLQISLDIKSYWEVIKGFH